MGSKFFAAPLAACVSLMETPIYATQPTDGLEIYDYSELILLRVILEGAHASACFGTPNGHVWVHLYDNVGNRHGHVDYVLKDRVGIEQIIGINGTDWVSARFDWPVARGEEAERLAKSCGDKPDQYHARAGQNPTAARDSIDIDRGERSPTMPGYDLSLRDAGHFYEAYVNPWESAVIPVCSLFKVFGFDYPQASRPTFSEISWAERGAREGVFGGIPSSSGCG